MIDAKASIHGDIIRDYPPLICAAAKGFENIVSLFIQKGVDMETTDCYGLYPLHYAVLNNHPNIAKLLLQNDSNPNKVTPDGLRLVEKNVVFIFLKHFY